VCSNETLKITTTKKYHFSCKLNSFAPISLPVTVDGKWKTFFLVPYGVEWSGVWGTHRLPPPPPHTHTSHSILSKAETLRWNWRKSWAKRIRLAAKYLFSRLFHFAGPFEQWFESVFVDFALESRKWPSFVCFHHLLARFSYSRVNVYSGKSLEMFFIFPKYFFRSKFVHFATNMLFTSFGTIFATICTERMAATTRLRLPSVLYAYTWYQDVSVEIWSKIFFGLGLWARFKVLWPWKHTFIVQKRV